MTSKTTKRFSPEVHTRAVQLVLDHEVEHRGLVTFDDDGRPQFSLVLSEAGRTEMR